MLAAVGADESRDVLVRYEHPDEPGHHLRGRYDRQHVPQLPQVVRDRASKCLGSQQGVGDDRSDGGECCE